MCRLIPYFVGMKWCVTHLIPVILFLLGVRCVSAHASVSAPSLPQDSLVADTLELGEINVTVIKQHDRLSKLPLASTSISGLELDRLDIVSFKGISDLVPNLLVPEYGSRITSSIYMRGLGARMDQPVVGLIVDNVPFLNKDAYDFDLADISAIEVLRGPQSTLYGRNTMGGQINISTLSPLRFQGWRAVAEFSSGTTARANLSWYHRFGTRHGLSLSAGYLYSKGFEINRYNGKKTDAQRLFNSRVKYEGRLTDDLTLMNVLAISRLDQSGYPYENVESGQISYNDTCFYRRFLLNDGLTLRLRTPHFLFSSITSFQYIDDNMTLDQDFLPKDYFTLTQKKRESALTQDFVFRSPDSDSRYKWLGGLFGFYRHLDMHAPVTFHDYGISQLIESHRNEANPDHPIRWDSRSFPLNSDFTIPSFGLAMYHESRYSLADWDFVLGIRFDYEKTSLRFRSHCDTGYTIFDLGPDGQFHPARHAAINIDDSGKMNRHFFEVLPKVAVLYRLPMPASNVYLNISKGYKSGGYNTQMFSDVLQQRLMGIMGIGSRLDIDDVVGYDPEYSWNFEIGSHLSFFDSRLRADLAVFYIDCRDQQLTMFPPGQTTGRIMTNAGKTRSCGFELSIYANPFDRFSVNLSYGFTDARFRRFSDGRNDYRGKFIPYAPRNTFFMQALYTFDLKNKVVSSLTLDAHLRGTGKIYWNEANSISQPFYLLPGASVTLENRCGSLQFWGKNLSSTNYYTFYFVSIGNEFRQKGRPISLGVTLRVNI